MDQIRTGSLIRRLRLEQGMTQLALAERLGVSDKAVSKWERGCGAPDLSILPLLSQALEVDTDTLLRGDLEANDLTNGNLKRMRFYLCPECGNLLISQENADISCFGNPAALSAPKHIALVLHTARLVQPAAVKLHEKRAAPAALFSYCPAGITTRPISSFSAFLSECSISPGTF